MLLLGVLAGPVPAALVAVAVNVYVPGGRPVTVHDGLVAEHV